MKIPVFIGSLRDASFSRTLPKRMRLSRMLEQPASSVASSGARG